MSKMSFRLNGVITAAEVVTGGGFRGQLHELVHGVSGYSYHMNLEAALTGDNAHVPGTCTVDHSSLQGPIWDWVKGFPDAIERADGNGRDEGLRLEANQECNDCPDDDMTTCCSFRFIDTPITKAGMVVLENIYFLFRKQEPWCILCQMDTRTQIHPQGDPPYKYTMVGHPSSYKWHQGHMEHQHKQIHSQNHS